MESDLEKIIKREGKYETYKAYFLTFLSEKIDEWKYPVDITVKNISESEYYDDECIIKDVVEDISKMLLSRGINCSCSITYMTEKRKKKYTVRLTVYPTKAKL